MGKSGRTGKITPSNQSISQNTFTNEESCWYKFHRFHIKHRDDVKAVSLELKLFRGISILLWFICAITDTVAYSKKLEWLPAIIVFCIKAPLYDIFTVLYASGSATFGVCYEIYPMLLLALTNLILALNNCDESQKIYSGLWLFKIICLFIATQLSYYNFKKLKDYSTKFSKATKYMLRHALVFTVSMIFLMAPGLRAAYQSITGECPYEISRCNVIELYEPLFNSTDSCEGSYTQYVVGREQLRILRDFLLIHIVSYAIYNQSFLAVDWKSGQSRFHYVMRVLLLLTFIFMSISAIVANMVPFDFTKFRIKLIFDIAEFIIFIIGIALLSLNLSYIQFELPEGDRMVETPDITDFD